MGDLLSGLFAGLAFIGVLYSLRLQIKENKEQKQDSERKRFEDTFFKMISLQLEIVNGLEYTWDNKSHKGRYVFQFMYEDSSSKLNNDVGTLEMGVIEKYSTKYLIEETGLEAYPKTRGIGILDHYFRNLYRIIKYVDEQSNELLADNKKYEYISNSVRSILSQYELIYLFYNCLSEVGYEKFKPLLEKYTLLKNINRSKLPQSKDLTSNIPYFNDPLVAVEIDPANIPYPKDEYEFRIDIDRLETNIPTDNYKLQAFYKKEEVIKWQQYYLDIRDNGFSREEANRKHFRQN